MPPKITYFTVTLGHNKIWQGATLDKIRAGIVDWYAGDVLYDQRNCPEATCIVDHTDDLDMVSDEVALDAFNRALDAEMSGAVLSCTYQPECGQISRSMGRV